ncbi:MAG: hypothetical protein JWO40_504 [Candidatus Doudnabacteria bacterium]|nr:hypothetical protein [Candidatus Doudnabacteria bacterium]
MNFKQKISLIVVVIALAVMPEFSVLSAFAQAQPTNVGDALPAAVNSFVLQLKDGNDQIFSNDLNVKNVEHVFLNTVAPQFKNTVRLNTTYSQSAFQSKYGYDLVYLDVEHLVSIGAIQISAGPSVNDPGFSSDPNDVDRQWGLYKAHFVDAWSQVPSGNNVVVAEIDTGVDATHEDLSSGQVLRGYNFITKSLIDPAQNSDDNGHGTLIAGVIAATQNNFRGIAGASWNSSIMPLKALDDKGSGNSADVASAIVYAADHGAGVINMSLGGLGFSNDTTLSNAIRYAYNKGVVIVSAAGNDVATTGGNLDTSPVFPVCNDNGENMVIGVAASDVNDQKASFSNYGKACVDVSAPGKRILSTINHDPVTHLPTVNGYAYASGTSLATPFVAAEAAMIKATYPSLNNGQIRNRILKSADSIDQLNTNGCNNQSCAGLIGSGRINALKALDPALIFDTIINEGDLVRDTSTNFVYYISGGKRQLVSPFVLSQRFSSTSIKDVDPSAFSNFPLGSYALPNQNTVVKSQSSPTVYMIVDGIKRPLTYQVFVQRNITVVNTLFDTELASWITGQFLPPVEGTIVRAHSGKTLYWVIDGLLHPINYAFWVDRGLVGRQILVIPDLDLQSYPSGTAFIK